MTPTNEMLYNPIIISNKVKSPYDSTYGVSKSPYDWMIAILDMDKNGDFCFTDAMVPRNLEGLIINVFLKTTKNTDLNMKMS